MICPFCGNEMVKGILSGDGRSPVVWKQGDKKTSTIDKIVGIGTVTAAQRTLASFTMNHFSAANARR